MEEGASGSLSAQMEEGAKLLIDRWRRWRWALHRRRWRTGAGFPSAQIEDGAVGLPVGKEEEGHGKGAEGGVGTLLSRAGPEGGGEGDGRPRPLAEKGPKICYTC